jgi:DNA-dependent metalloprotease WSS1
MPLGYERLNVKKTQPNANIVFIKPLEGPDKDVAQDFLERIAAQCRECRYRKSHPWKANHWL